MTDLERDAWLDEIEPEIKAMRESLLKYYPENSAVMKALNYIEICSTTAVSTTAALEYAEAIVAAEKKES